MSKRRLSRSSDESQPRKIRRHGDLPDDDDMILFVDPPNPQQQQQQDDEDPPYQIVPDDHGDLVPDVDIVVVAAVGGIGGDNTVTSFPVMLYQEILASTSSHLDFIHTLIDSMCIAGVQSPVAPDIRAHILRNSVPIGVFLEHVIVNHRRAVDYLHSLPLLECFRLGINYVQQYNVSNNPGLYGMVTALDVLLGADALHDIMVSFTQVYNPLERVHERLPPMRELAEDIRRFNRLMDPDYPHSAVAARLDEQINFFRLMAICDAVPVRFLGDAHPHIIVIRRMGAILQQRLATNVSIAQSIGLTFSRLVAGRRDGTVIRRFLMVVFYVLDYEQHLDTLPVDEDLDRMEWRSLVNILAAIPAIPPNGGDPVVFWGGIQDRLPRARQSEELFWRSVVRRMRSADILGTAVQYLTTRMATGSRTTGYLFSADERIATAAAIVENPNLSPTHVRHLLIAMRDGGDLGDGNDDDAQQRLDIDDLTRADNPNSVVLTALIDRVRNGTLSSIGMSNMGRTGVIYYPIDQALPIRIDAARFGAALDLAARSPMYANHTAFYILKHVVANFRNDV